MKLLPPTRIEALRGHRIRAIAAGETHNLAVADDGVVFSWGDGRFGKLGHADLEHHIVPARIQSLNGVPITAVAAGPRHSLAISRDGRAFGWGFADETLGLGYARLETEPLAAAVPAVARSFCVASAGSLALGAHISPPLLAPLPPLTRELIIPAPTLSVSPPCNMSIPGSVLSGYPTHVLIMPHGWPTQHVAHPMVRPPVGVAMACPSVGIALPNSSTFPMNQRGAILGTHATSNGMHAASRHDTSCGIAASNGDGQDPDRMGQQIALDGISSLCQLTPSEYTFSLRVKT